MFVLLLLFLILLMISAVKLGYDLGKSISKAAWAVFFSPNRNNK